MAEIDRVTARLFRIPLPTTLSDNAHGFMPDFELVTVEVVDADGARGVGYTYTVGRGGRAVRALAEEAAELVADLDASHIAKCWEAVWKGLHWGGRGGPTSLALSALDIALWDLAGVRTEQPLWKLLGGHDRTVACYAGGIDLEFTIEELLDQADGFLEDGFRAIKMKVGRPSITEDLARATAMREHLGDDFPLMVDVNMGWSVDRAVTAARALRDIRLVWLEEPTSPEDIPGHRRILTEGGVPIAAGENLHSPYEFGNYIREGAVSFPEPDVTNCGGVTAFMQVAHAAAAVNLPVTSHGAHDLSVHLLAAAGNASYLEMHGFSLDDYIDDPLEVVDGNVLARQTPGHGVRFDWERLATFEQE